jgi:protein-tyrosine phosphatase
MIPAMERIPNFTQISENLALGGQPPEPYFSVLQKVGFQLIVHLQIKNLDLVIRGEEMIVAKAGMLYEHIIIDYDAPCREVFLSLSQILTTYRGLKIFVHCTAGFCSSALIIPYLVKYHGLSLEEANAAVVDWTIPPLWKNVIEEVLAEPDLLDG